jgi:hypothetical protein
MTRFGLREMTFDFDMDGARELTHPVGPDQASDPPTPGWYVAALQGIIAEHHVTERWPDPPAPIVPLRHAYREEGNHA